jgi:phage/plasmid-like protein (TIGR03299 family)
VSTPTIDVNQAFHAERTEQVANIRDLMSDEGRARYITEQTARLEARVVSGELVKIGEGRFQSTQGWDRGEVWTVRDVDGRSLVIPEHGLDIDPVTGRARLFSAAEPWHGLGQVIPGGVTDIDEVITLGQLDVPAFSVPVPQYTVPGIVASDGSGPAYYDAPGQFIVGNGRTGEFWGIVGKVHQNLPVRQSFEFMTGIVGAKVGDQEVTFESAGMMNGGRKVFIACEIPGGVLIDADGAADYTRLFLVVQDVRDGSGSYKAMLTPWRPICGNTNRFALRDAVSVVNLRHTTNLPSRIEQARAVLGVTVNYRDAFAAEAETLIRTQATIDDFRSVMSDLFAEDSAKTASGRVWAGRDRDAEAKAVRTRNANDRRESALEEQWSVETGRVGANLYAAEQALTAYLDWDMVRKGSDAASRWQNRITANLAGESDALKSRGHGRLLELATR